jgi:HSP20 family protein
MYSRPFDPWGDVSRIQRQMNRMFDNDLWSGRADFPAVNIWANEDNVLVTTELPGYEKDDVDISLVGDILKLNGTRKAPECGEDDCFHRQERNYGVFSRELQLPYAVDVARVDATFNNGVLKISLQRAEETKPKKINIMSN